MIKAVLKNPARVDLEEEAKIREETRLKKKDSHRNMPKKSETN